VNRFSQVKLTDHQGVSILKNTFKFLVSRFIKVFANAVKLFCYVFHFFFPKKRFTLPKTARPLFKSKYESVIPRVLWQTNFTDRVTLAVYANYLFNRMLAPTYEYRFLITEDRAEFIRENFSQQIFESYSRLQLGASQADFWRILVLLKKGGVYLDIDGHFVWPLGLIVKPEYPELYISTKRGDISNYFIASKKDNAHLESMVKIILRNIDENTLTNVFALTGPYVFHEVLNDADVNTVTYRYSVHQGNFTNEHFQYIDKPQGKWTKAQAKIDLVK
jgi:mannosyltransferase OCH1-like enzyme